uniref:SCP2 sterol-binding domain-containing protein n=1 Tax=Acetatifactor sp. TaxID=1872090 RepID=UPI004056F024
MNINIYYGGRGIIDDPTNYVINKIQEVLEELRVNVVRYNLYECKNTIPTLPQTLKEADGIILATTVEWYGIGGYMQQFLDACWLYGDKEKISKIYMCPIVMSTTYGEREAKLNLSTAWEILGGLPCSGICGYINNTVELELNKEYLHIIEKKAENIYRTISQKMSCFPASNQAVEQKVSISPQNIDLTPQESEQLSQYVSDDNYVQRQKEDIQELAGMFRNLMNNEGADSEEEYLAEFRRVYKPQAGFKADYSIIIEEKPKNMIISIRGIKLECRYGSVEEPDVEMHMNRATMDDIVNGRMTFQRAFMSGAMKMKGDFSVLRALDQVFLFEEIR